MSFFQSKQIKPTAQDVTNPAVRPLIGQTAGTLGGIIGGGPTGPTLQTPLSQAGTAGLLGVPEMGGLFGPQQAGANYLTSLLGQAPGPSGAGLAAADALTQRYNTLFGRERESTLNDLARAGILHSGERIDTEGRLQEQQGQVLSSALAPYLFGSAESQAGRQFGAAQLAPTYGQVPIQTALAQLQAGQIPIQTFLQYLGLVPPFIGATNQQLAQPQYAPSAFSQIAGAAAAAAPYL